MHDNPDPRIGTVLQGRYRLLHSLAEGGMGVVYKGERLGLGRSVAVKFLHGHVARQRQFMARFEREARATSRLAHPHCVPVIDFGVEKDEPYIVMEYVEGQTLADLIDRGPIPVSRAVKIVRQVLAGLAHAHGLSIVHRDIKPANVILVEATGTGDHARILDFGLAKLLEKSEVEVSLSTSQIAVGTPSYMSPEQARGEPADERSDLYSTAIVLYELICGRKPFSHDEPLEVLKMHLHTPPPTLAEGLPGCGASPALEEVVARALAKLPGERYQTALAFAEALAATPEAGAETPRPAVDVDSSLPVRDAAQVVLTRLPDIDAPEPETRSRGWLVWLVLALLAAGGGAAAWVLLTRGWLVWLVLALLAAGGGAAAWVLLTR